MSITPEQIDLWRQSPSEHQRLEFKEAKQQFDYEKLCLPEVAVRELVANALIHQDLTMTGASVMLEVYSNRLEISNPGEPVVPVERFIDGYQSRNERLAGLMRRMGICEEKSSGVDRVVRTAEVCQLPAPDFRVGHARTIVIVYGPKAFDDMDREDRVAVLATSTAP